MPEVFLSLGSNLDRETHLPAALDELAEWFGELRVSGIYEAAAVGFEGPPFHNLAVGFATEWPLGELVARLADLEIRHGRAPDSRKFSSRKLDVDLLLYGDAVLREGKLELPRPDILRYAFVLEPLAEIAPDHRHPVTGQRYADLWAGFDKTGLVQRRIG